MNISAKVHLYPHTDSEELIFLNIFRKLSLLVAMTTDQTERFGQKLYVC